MAAEDRRYFDEIQAGEEYVSPGRTVTEADIVIFAGLSGDYNVLHTDAEFMKSSVFGERIAAVSFARANAGTMASRSGSDRATPAPRRKLRRDRERGVVKNGKFIGGSLRPIAACGLAGCPRSRKR